MSLVGSILLTAEWIARDRLGLGSPPLYVADPLTEYRLKPNQNLRRFGNRIAVNAVSMRSPPLAARRPAQRRRLLVFGDSVVWGGSVLDQRHIATSILQASGWPEVGNVSAPSWGPGNWLGYARRFGLFDATDVVLVISSGDAADNPSPRPFRGDVDHPLRPPSSALLEGLQRYLLPRLGLKPNQEGNPAPGAAAAPLSRPDDPRARRGLADLRAFLRLARASGARIAVVQFADRQEASSGDLQPGNHWIARVLDEEGIASLQAGPIFRGCGAIDQLYVDAIHPYTQAGQACLAKAIAKALAQAKRVN